jgi:hypothetical protein
MGSWRGIAAKIIISEGSVFEYDYSGHPQQGLGQTIISGDTLTFRTQRGSVITLTKRVPIMADAHYHSPFGEADGELVRLSPGAPQSSDWDGTWIGAWRGEIEAAAKVVIGGDNVLEYDYNGNPQWGFRTTNISGNTLTFGTPRGFVITLTKHGTTAAAAHYHNSRVGEADGELVRQ